MKARLGELQARLDSHERQRIHTATHASNEMPHGVTGVPVPFNPNTVVVNGASNVNTLTGLGPIMSTGHVVEASQSPLGNDQQPSQLPMLQTNMYDLPADEPEPSLFSHNAKFLNSPPNSHPSPQAQNGLLSPPGRSDSEQSTKVSQDFVLDCLRFQTQLLNRLNTLQQDAGCPNQVQYNHPEGIPQCMSIFPRQMVPVNFDTDGMQ